MHDLCETILIGRKERSKQPDHLWRQAPTTAGEKRRLNRCQCQSQLLRYKDTESNNEWADGHATDMYKTEQMNNNEPGPCLVITPA
jgi:hypothetical protein